MIADQNRIYDGWDNVIGGVDFGRRPNLIDRGDREQAAEAENVVFRGGAPTTRPALRKLTLSFDNPNLHYDANGFFGGETGGGGSSQNVFWLGNFQGATYYAPREGQEYIMVSIAGHLFQLTPGETTCSVREIELRPRRNRANIPIAFHVQADAYFIVQDNEAAPIIFDGVTARRATTDEIFTGSIMAYGLNRIVLIGKDGLIYFGDIRDGKGNGGADVLGFTETKFLNEGFPSALPSSCGQARAIAFLPQQDAATGVGDCLMFGESGVEGFTLSIPREMWKDSQFQRPVLRKIGCVGHRQLAEVNNDIWFRASDGWRSYRQARAEVDKWAQIPLSTNVQQYVGNDTPELLRYGSAIEFDNRLLATSQPQPNVVNSFYAVQRLYHNGLLSLDFDILSTFGKETEPAWDGRWLDHDRTSFECLQVVTGKFGGRSRAFLFRINDAGLNTISEITQSETTDTTGPITARLRGRSMDFGSEYNEKVLYGGDVWVDDVKEPVSVTVRYRPDQINQWQDWDSFSVNAIGTPGAITPGMVPTLAPGYGPRTALQKPGDAADPVTKRIYRRGYEFQPEITWTGHAAMRKFRMQDQTETENSKAKV